MLGLFRLKQNRPGLRQKSLACLRQFRTVRQAAEKGRTNLVFKITYLIAERRLADANFPCGAREIELFCDGHEITKMTKLHVILLRYRLHLRNILELSLLAAT